MANGSDTLNIGSIRLRKEYPMAQTPLRAPAAAQNPSSDPMINPAAAASARARIAALPEYHPMAGVDSIPATPTVELITDKATLAGQPSATPLTKRRGLPSVFVPIATAAGVFLLVLLLFKAPVIYSQISYNLSSKKPVATVPAATASEVIPAEATISIPKINVHAPVIYEPSVQEAAVQSALQNGVVHYGNTPDPGQPGNVAIFGHSSNDWWEPGNYKFVFVLLDKLSPGDQVTMDFQSKRYTYQVIGSKVVEPTDVGVLNPTATPTLTIITCTPPGTSLKRLVVTAKQINPDPGQTKAVATPAATTTATGTTTLPSSSNGILQSLSQAWKGVYSGLTSLFGGDNNDAPSPSASPASTAQLPASK